MTRWLYVVSRACAERGKLVLVLWLLAAIAIMGTNRALGPSTQNSFSLAGTDSSTAQQLLNQAFPGSSTDSNPIVLYSPTIDLGTGAGAENVEEVADAERALPQVSSVTTPKTQPTLLSADGHTAMISIVVADSALGDESTGADILTTAQETAAPGIQVALGGFLGQQLSKPNTHSSEIIGLLAALLVLFFTLRRFSAMFVPLINAVFAVGIGLAVIGLLGRVVFIPDVAPTLGTMLGLGVGIDYALFLITRHRKLLQQGFSVPDAVGRTAGTAGAGIVFAGCTLIAAMCGLILTGISFLAWLGISAGIVVLVAIAASLTLVPALLGVFGQRVVPKSMAEQEGEDHEVLDRSGWARLANAVTTRPWRFAISSTVVLLLLAAPTLTLTLGHSDAGDLPETTTARQANDLIVQGFGAGTTAPLAVVVQMYSPATAPADAPTGEGDPRTLDPRLTTLRQDIAATPGVVSTSAPIVSTDGGVATIKVIPEWSSSNPNTEALVNTLRDTTLPEATADEGMSAHVGGITALYTDLSVMIASRTLGFILGVVVLAFILLMLAYRSVLIPFKAAVMNLLSIAAAYGVITVVFQWGWGTQLIGLDGPVPIESYVPMMMFAVLFGLSMDYEVFLLTAFREHWERTGDMTTAVRRGLADTGRLVTAAALIMVAVFGSFILSDDSTVKIFGVGLSTAVLVDATIVRCLLVPAIMVLAQKGTWWIPGWLDRLLPQLHVEGDPGALDEIASAKRQPGPGRQPLLLHRPAAVVGSAVGVGISWALVSRLPGLPQYADTAVAVSAVLGAIAVLLPPGFGGGKGGRGMRTLGFFLGVILGLFVIGLLTMIVPPVKVSEGLVTSWAVVLLAMVVVLLVARSLALPLILGAIATAIALAAMGPGESTAMALLITTLLPAVITIVVTSLVAGFFEGRARPIAQTHEQVEPTHDAQLVSVGELLSANKEDPDKSNETGASS